MRELVTTRDNRLSQTKVWSNIAAAVATWVIIKLTLDGKMTEMLFWAYLGTVGGFAQISKWMSYKYGGNQPAAESSPVQTVTTQSISKCPDCPTPEKETTKPAEQIPEGD